MGDSHMPLLIRMHFKWLMQATGPCLHKQNDKMINMNHETMD